MLKDLVSRLFAPTPEALPPADARLALAALLVRIARSDGDYAAEEIARIDRILAARYGFDAAAAADLRRQAEALEAAAPDTVRFTRAIKEAVPHDERAAVLEALWEVVLADGVRDAQENALMRLAADLLGIGDRDSHILRQRVAARMG